MGGDLHSITVAEPYSSDYIMFLGFPNWWGDMPMALYTFLDSYDLSGDGVDNAGDQITAWLDGLGLTE